MTTVLHVNQTYAGGGAANIARTLHEGYLARNIDSWMLVDQGAGEAPFVKPLNWTGHRPAGLRSSLPVRRLLHGRRAGQAAVPAFLEGAALLGKDVFAKLLGHENFNFPASWRLLELIAATPDLLQLHNLHNNWFDLRALPTLSSRLPVAMTLHDMWALTGHCAHALDCSRWRSGCGRCPDLTIYPALTRDGTRFNWRRKRAIYTRSRLHVATPSRWLMQCVERSPLAVGIADARVIPNGVDQAVFHPGSTQAARASIGVPDGAVMLLFTADLSRGNAFKDSATLQQAIHAVGRRLSDRAIVFVTLGGGTGREQQGNTQLLSVPYQQDPAMVARYYQAADIYVHAAKADTFPSAVIEALSCGTPVVATAVGGIPEQIRDGITGFLVPPGESDALVRRVVELVCSQTLRERMSQQAFGDARQRFSAERMTDEYLAWHRQLIERFTQKTAI